MNVCCQIGEGPLKTADHWYEAHFYIENGYKSNHPSDLI